MKDTLKRVGELGNVCGARSRAAEADLADRMARSDIAYPMMLQGTNGDHSQIRAFEVVGLLTTIDGLRLRLDLIARAPRVDLPDGGVQVTLTVEEWARVKEVWKT